ncbi:SpoIIE family protein phosphatase [Streptomyces sp. NPDC059176]|uniref:SpoIIE family protein phosphatase n=1 Tax=unclassified Streptomyces TaxID=2593676 RepID=UPI00368F569F
MRGTIVSPTAERDDLLAAAVVKAVAGTGAYAGSVFIRSHDRRAVVLAATCGVPPSQLGGWRLIPVNSPIPVAVAYRTGRTVHLAGAEETVRRFPQLAMALPHSFGSCAVPIGTRGESFGALAVVWGASRGGAGLTKAQRRQLRAAAGRLGAALADLVDRTGDAVECDLQTVPVETPAPTDPAVRVGLFDWNLDTDAFSADDELRTIFGLDPDTSDLRPEVLAARLHPGDLATFRGTARSAAAEGRVGGRRLRVREASGADRYRTVELWGRLQHTGGEDTGTHLVGSVVDATVGTAAAAAVERLREGLFSLAPDGRVSHLNQRLGGLLGVRVEELLGRCLWDVLPWLSDPDIEFRYRTAMIEQAPVSFTACRPSGQWLAFHLHPEADGVTGWVVPVGRAAVDAAAPDVAAAEPPVPGGGSVPPPVPDAPAVAPPAARMGVMYHVLQLGCALTEAVTAREVCGVVADQLLPAFGGQQLAIHVVREGAMHLIFHTGDHEDFLDWLEGVPLHARLPGTEALTSGAPLFIESQADLCEGYPDIPTDGVSSWAYLPLIASSRPIGTCVLGFDEAHRFTAKDRGVLTALAGLIAQALERARLYDSEFALARGLQQALLPHRLPVVPGVRTAARYLPGTSGMDIGGDWYDVIPTEDGVCLVIGDVEGHSVAAAATMAQLRSAVRAFTAVGHVPGEVVAGANQTLIDLDPGLLASCCYLRVEPRDHRAYAVCAGHPPPLLRDPGGATCVLGLDPGPLLGVDRASHYPGRWIDLPAGSVLALYTDGLVEERGTGIEVGIDRLRASLAHARADSLDELADRLLHGARGWAYRADDIALLLTEYEHSHSGDQAPE